MVRLRDIAVKRVAEKGEDVEREKEKKKEEKYCISIRCQYCV